MKCSFHKILWMSASLMCIARIKTLVRVKDLEHRKEFSSWMGRQFI